jgi:rod shape-determining protein MreC
MDVVSQPVSSVRNFVDRMEGLAALQAENSRLRAENARLQGWEAAARRMEQENAALKAFFNLKTREEAEFISARVVADSGSAFVRSRLVNAGLRDGIVAGQAVMTGEGLAGRIVQVGELSARVLLVTDLNSRIPVMVEKTRVAAILAGDNSPRPRLMLLPAGAEVAVGARIVTSGHASAFPPGLPVGAVAADDDGVLRVEPFADLARMEYVRVVDYNLEGILRTVDQPTAAGGRE